MRAALSRHPGSVALASALLALGDTTVWYHARELAAGSAPPPGALRLLAMQGDLRDEEILRRAPDSAEAMSAMGILGSPALIYDLLRRLSVAAQDPTLGGAAADALERITGAGLREVVQASDLKDEACDYEEPAAPVECISRDPDRWTAFFRQHAARFVTRGRYRGGRTFRPESCLDELVAPDSSFAWRTDAAEEWSLHSQRPAPLEPDHWITAQRVALAQLGRAP